MNKYYPIDNLKKLSKPMIIEIERNTHMEDKLKDVIRSEMDNVTKMLISPECTDKITLTKWLQSLQRINDICRERNRY